MKASLSVKHDQTPKSSDASSFKLAECDEGYGSVVGQVVLSAYFCIAVITGEAPFGARQQCIG